MLYINMLYHGVTSSSSFSQQKKKEQKKTTTTQFYHSTCPKNIGYNTIVVFLVPNPTANTSAMPY